MKNLDKPKTMREENVDDFLDSLVDIFGTEPDGHKTWVKTTDEIQEALKQPLKVFIDSQLQSVFEEIFDKIEKRLGSGRRKYFNKNAFDTWDIVGIRDDLQEDIKSIRQKYLKESK